MRVIGREVDQKSVGMWCSRSEVYCKTKWRLSQVVYGAEKKWNSLNVCPAAENL